MVQGTPAVKWTPENNAKLLAAIVTFHSGVIDLKQLAAVFGPDVPTSAISYRMGTLRKEGAAMGLTSNGSNGVSKRAPAVRNTQGNKGKGRKRVGGMLSDVASDDESNNLKDDTEVEQEATPPDTDSGETHAAASKTPTKRQKTISGRITKARVSPRKTMKKDYKALEDPFTAMKGTTDADGEKVFDTDKSEGEDSFVSDAEYLKDAKAATVKMEEAI